MIFLKHLEDCESYCHSQTFRDAPPEAPKLLSLAFTASSLPASGGHHLRVFLENRFHIFTYCVREGVKKNCEKAVRLTAWVDPP